MKTTVKIFVVVLFALFMIGCAAKKNNLMPMMYDYELSEIKTLIQNDKNLQALDELNMLIQMSPSNADALLMRGVVYQKLERYNDAVKDYQKVATLKPTEGKAYYNLGMIYAYKLNEKKLALKHFDQFLSIDPENEASFDVAKVMMNLDQSDSTVVAQSVEMQQVITKAEQSKNVNQKRVVLNDGLRQYPNSPIFYLLLGNTYADERSKESFDTARDYYEKSLEQRITCAQCQRKYGDLLRDKNPKESMIRLKKAKLFEPKQ